MMSFSQSGLVRTALHLVLVVLLCGPALAGQTLTVELRSRVAIPDSPKQSRVACQTQQWDLGQTAIIICDMWDQHWCKGATERVAELAPVINRVVCAARDRGVLIVHAPSGTIDHYRDHPARLTAMRAPGARNLPEGIRSWCQWKDDAEKAAGYPIDHSDGGCDCLPRCLEGEPWTRQIDAIQIEDRDAISDSGAEVW
ncbi:MAG: hypothetical protein GX448_13025, partial [Planctomycetes bacterium]|nr:hypothetical protein [Planctomycetota bacterium]